MESESREWNLQPETEYRFELDPGTTVAIKVCSQPAVSRAYIYETS